MTNKEILFACDELNAVWNELYEMARINTKDIEKISAIQSAQRGAIYGAMEVLEKRIKALRNNLK